jgi:hypothetical protein
MMPTPANRRRKRQRNRRAFAGDARGPHALRGFGQGPLTRLDLALIRQAITDGWATSPRVRAAAQDDLDATIEARSQSDDPRATKGMFRAINLVFWMDRRALAQERVAARIVTHCRAVDGVRVAPQPTPPAAPVDHVCVVPGLPVTEVTTTAHGDGTAETARRLTRNPMSTATTAECRVGDGAGVTQNGTNHAPTTANGGPL